MTRMPQSPGLQADCCWPSHNRRGLCAAPVPAPAANGPEPAQGRGPGWSRLDGRPLSPPQVRPRAGPRQRAILRLWLGTTPPCRPSPWPRSSTHDSSSASCRSTFLSANAFASAKLLRRLAKVSPPCACTGTAYVMSREPRDWPAPSGATGLGVPVRRGVARCRKKRSAFWQRGIAVPFYRSYENVRSCNVILYLEDEINKTVVCFVHAAENEA